MKSENKRNKGFSLPEILLVIALMAVVAGILSVFDRVFLVRNDLEITREVVVQSVRQAQMSAQANEGDSEWGIKLNSGEIVVFQGSSYEGRDPEFDEIFETTSSINFSGVDEIVFAKMTGLPNTTGEIIMNSDIDESKIVTVNSRGIAY